MDLCPKENDRLCLLAEPVVFESCFRLGLGKSPLALAGFRPVFAALRNTRRFTSAAAKIVKLRTTHGTLADDGNAVDVGRIEREHALDTFAERHFAHGEVGAHTPVRAREAPALEILDTRTFARSTEGRVGNGGECAGGS